MAKILISTPKQAHAHLRKIRTEMETILADKKAHEERKKLPRELSLMDYMHSKGMPAKFSDREELAKNYGMKYYGTSDHDKKLLSILMAQHGNTDTHTDE